MDGQAIDGPRLTDVHLMIVLVRKDVSVCIDAVGWGQKGGSNQAGGGVVVGSSGASMSRIWSRLN